MILRSSLINHIDAIKRPSTHTMPYRDKERTGKTTAEKTIIQTDLESGWIFYNLEMEDKQHATKVGTEHK